MMRYLISVVLLAILGSLVAGQICKNTHLQFFSQYSLGRQDELNNTFDSIQNKTKLDAVIWIKNGSATYEISRITHKFNYLDSNQKASIQGKDRIQISGGKVIVQLNFQWYKTGFQNTNGTGTATFLSDIITFVVALKVDAAGFLVQSLDDAPPVRFHQQFVNLIKITPANITVEDNNNVLQLLKKVEENVSIFTVRQSLEKKIGDQYFVELSTAIYANKRSMNSHYDYRWSESRSNFTVPIDLIAQKISILPNEGYQLIYKAMITNYTDWKCQFDDPQHRQNLTVYGGIQQFISYDVYLNVLRYALDKGQLNTELTRSNWQSKYFQFFAGDLFQVIPQIGKKHFARDQLNGICKSNSKVVDISKSSLNDGFLVNLTYSCQLSSKIEIIATFEVTLNLTIEGRPNNTALNFYVINETHTTKFIQYRQYQIKNEILAHLMVNNSINRLIEHRTFGSGWSMYPKDYPHFKTYPQYTLSYDSSFIGGERDE